MSFRFLPVWGWPLTLIVIVGLFALTWQTARRGDRRLSTTRRRLLLGVRLTTATMLAWALLRPELQTEEDSGEDAVLYLLADTSLSMATEDETGGVSRWSRVLKTVDQATEVIEEFAEDLEVHVRTYSADVNELVASTALADQKPDGRETRIATALETVSEEAGTSTVAGIFWLTDGRQAVTGREADDDPLSVARRMGRRQQPIYGVPFGSSDLVNSAADARLENLDIPQDVFQGNVVPVRVRLRALGLNGQAATVRVLLEDRSGKNPGESGPLNPVPADRGTRTVIQQMLSTADEDMTLELSVIPRQTGEIRIAVEVEPLSGELRTRNNRVETIIRVRSGGIRIAYFDTLRPEQTFLRDTNISNRIQLDFQPIRSGLFRDRNRFDDSWLTPGNYDAYIIGDVPADIFGRDRLMQLRRCVDAGAGLMMTGGLNNFGPGGYGSTPLASVLPLELTEADGNLTGAVRVIPTRDGLSHYIMQIASGGANRERWAELPPLQGASLLRVRDASLAQVLAESDTGAPLLVGQAVGRSRVLAFAGDTTWKWPMEGFAEEHTRFWRQLLFWVTGREADTDQPVWIQADSRDPAAGEVVGLSFGARRDGLPVSNADYDVEILTPDGGRLPLTPTRTEYGGTVDFTEAVAPGDYWARVTALEPDGGYLGGSAYARFVVNARDPERDNPAADPDMIREVAFLTGGDILTPDEWIARLKEWAENGIPGLAGTRTETTPLWDNWWIVLLLTGSLSIQWGLRRKSGLV